VDNVKRSLGRRAVGGPFNPVTSTSPLSRVCPKCDAPAEVRCQYYSGSRVNGTGYWKSRTTVHPERQTHRSGKNGDE